MPSPPRVHVVMATYNGAPYLREQIASLQRQGFRDWVLWVRDDGSTDGTQALLCEIAAGDPRIRLLQDTRGNLGPKGNFGALLQTAHAAGADYVFLADQDDVWMEGKMERQLALMERLTEAAGGALPCLVHSDLEVVDRHLNRLAPSFMSLRGLRDEPEPLPVLLAQNFITGCTLLVNRPLLDRALPIPPQALMHDWWLALCAAAAGRIGFLPERTVRYRQHDRNNIGAKSYWGRVLPHIRRLRDRRHFAAGFRQTLAQAEALTERAAQQEGGDGRERLLREYCELPSLPAHRRLLRLFRLGVYRQGYARHLLLLLQVAVMGGQRAVGE